MTEPTIFIVDDDEAYRDSLVELVASVGLHCECFASALNFLAAFDPARAGCLVLDVRMARMSGLALQARLKTMGATLPIVFISGHGDLEMAVKAIKDGAVDFVQKPYREQQLLDAIKRGLAARRAAAPHAAAGRWGGARRGAGAAQRTRARGHAAGAAGPAEQADRQAVVP
jgi:FixJ family two-component response regulator